MDKSSQEAVMKSRQGVVVVTPNVQCSSGLFFRVDEALIRCLLSPPCPNVDYKLNGGLSNC